MSISVLIEAAEFLDRIERQRENALLAQTVFNNPASTYWKMLNDTEDQAPPPSKKRRISFTESSNVKQLSKPNINTQTFVRPSHNELEKNRRASMRLYLENLKEIVPLYPDSTRHTTLSLLTKAAAYVKNLEDEERRLENERNILLAHKKFLQRRMQLLTGRITGYLETNVDNVLSTTIISDNNQVESSSKTPTGVDSSNLNVRSASTQLPTETKFIDATSTSENILATNESAHLSPAKLMDTSCDKIRPDNSFTCLDNYQDQFNAFYSYYNNYYNNSLSHNNSNFIHGKQATDGLMMNDYSDPNGSSWFKNFQPNLLFFNQCVYQSLINKHFAPLEIHEPSKNSMVKLLSPLNCSP